MSNLGWGVVNGDERIIPQSGVREMKLESGKPKRVALLGSAPYSFFQHSLESEKIENGQVTTMFRTVNCPKTKDNPNAHCPLCDGQQARRRIRHSIAVWDYENNEATLLTNGDDVFKPMGTMGKMGMDPGTMDWVVSKSGTTKNDTTYSSVNMGPKQLPALPDGTDIPDPIMTYKPNTVDEMKTLVESMGLNWNSLIVPPPVQYPESLQEALDHVIPNTKYKGQTMKQVWDTNKGMIEFFAKSNRISEEKGCAQVILVALGGVQIDGVPNYANGGKVIQNSQPTVNPPVVNPPVNSQPTNDTTVNPPINNQPTSAPSATADGDRQAKIQQINECLQSNEKFVKGGYTVIMETMKEASGGKTSINDFTDTELDKMIELVK